MIERKNHTQRTWKQLQTATSWKSKRQNNRDAHQTWSSSSRWQSDNLWWWTGRAPVCPGRGCASGSRTSDTRCPLRSSRLQMGRKDTMSRLLSRKVLVSRHSRLTAFQVQHALLFIHGILGQVHVARHSGSDPRMRLSRDNRLTLYDWYLYFVHVCLLYVSHPWYFLQATCEGSQRLDGVVQTWPFWPWCSSTFAYHKGAGKCLISAVLWPNQCGNSWDWWQLNIPKIHHCIGPIF